MSVDISVVILSYDRVHLLERTLRGCAVQGGDWGGFEIIVVDNHPDQLARRLVEGLTVETGVAMTYLADPRRNISIVRNKGIAAAQGRYVAFIDDDEEPQAGWLAALTACLDRTGADAAFGPKLPEFEGGRAPDWDPEGWRYTLDFQMPADEQIHMFGRLRKRGKGLGSGNAAFRGRDVSGGGGAVQRRVRRRQRRGHAVALSPGDGGPPLRLVPRRRGAGVHRDQPRAAGLYDHAHEARLAALCRVPDRHERQQTPDHGQGGPARSGADDGPRRPLCGDGRVSGPQTSLRSPDSAWPRAWAS